MKNVFFSLILLLSSFSFGTTLSWNDFKIPPGEVGSLWAESVDLIFFPSSTFRPASDQYKFKVHSSLFGTVSNQIVQGRYGQDHALNGHCTGLDTFGYKTCTLPAQIDGSDLSELHMYGGNGQDYLNICRLVFASNEARRYLPDGVFYGDKAWPHHGEEVSCAFNPSPLFPVDNDDNRKNVIGAISLGHKGQSSQASFNSITTSNPIIDLPVDQSIEIGVVAASPYGQGLTPSITLIPARGSIANAPKIKLFGTDGKWPLPIGSGYIGSEGSLQHNYKAIDNDLTTPHQYVLRIHRTEDHLHLKWYVNHKPTWSGNGVPHHEGFLYATSTIPLSGGLLSYHLELALDAALQDPSVEVPVTDQSYFNIFDLYVKEVKAALTQQKPAKPESATDRLNATSVISLMDLLQARSGYHRGNQEKQVYWTNQSVKAQQSWTLTTYAIPEVNCDPMDPSAGRCTYTSGWIDTYGTWSTGASPRGMLVIKARISPAAGKYAKGLWPAIWMLPRSIPPLGQEAKALYTWPINGEVDIFEGWGSDLGKYATTLHYGADAATRWSYMGTEYSAPSFTTTDANHYAVSWDFSENDGAPVFKWWVKTQQNPTWALVREQKTNDLVSARKIIDCPALGPHFPSVLTSAHVCFTDVFRAGQTSQGLDVSPQTGYYLIANLAVGGHFDGNPVDDLSGSQMRIEEIHFHDNVVDPKDL